MYWLAFRKIISFINRVLSKKFQSALKAERLKLQKLIYSLPSYLNLIQIIQLFWASLYYVKIEMLLLHHGGRNIKLFRV